MRRRGLAVALAAALALAPAVAPACGYCVEDRIAAAYDHAVLRRALAVRHAVAYFALDGLRGAGERERLELARLIEAVPGVDRGSVRVSIEGAAASFAYDPARGSLARVTNLVERRLSARGLSLGLLRVSDR